jgi:hypothetical protein
LTNMCVSCRKSKTVTGPRVRSNKSLRPSAVNSPLPEARRLVRPVFVGIFWLLFALSRSSVVRKFRGKAAASFRSTSQINTGESASAGRTGGFFCTSVAEKFPAGVRSNANSTGKALDGGKTRFRTITRQIGCGLLSARKKFPRNGVFIFLHVKMVLVRHDIRL